MSTTHKRKRNGLFYSRGEETVNSLSHGMGISMAVIIGGFFLMKCYRAQDPWAILGMWLYLFGMGGSYLSSTLYHSLKHHNPWKRRLRHWDHAAIYWHIAGSFSPVTLIALRDEGLWGWGLFCFVWLCAVAGTIISFRKMKEHSYVETVCYILMGLSVLVVFKQLFAVISSHRSRVPYLCACARHGDRLVQPFASAEDFHAQRAHRFTGTNKMIYRIYVVNIQGTEIQYPHSFTSTFLLRLLSAPAGTGSLRTAASCV